MNGPGIRIGAAMFFLACGIAGATPKAWPGEANGRWIAGDFHSHTWLTDGNHTPEEVALHAFSYGLDWFANSEHGGVSRKDTDGKPFPAPIPRWITLKYHSFPVVQRLRDAFPQKRILQGLEWNVPGHGHASVGIVAEGPDAISDFEFACDAADKDTGRSVPKQNRTHADALACIEKLKRDHGEASYFIPNHPSRDGNFTPADLRDFHNAAPEIAFGFEGIPGHQKASTRGGYGRSFPDPSAALRARTYGGADHMAAKVGGPWDALLGEGRRFFLFGNSDFHDAEGDFWPGEYTKSFVFVNGNTLRSIVDGMRSGNSFAVLGGLIDGLSFIAATADGNATMGETLRVSPGERVRISVAFHSPAVNNHGDVPRVDHIDLITGKITGEALPWRPEYSADTHPTARVAARISSRDWKCESGWCRASIDHGPAHEGMYFRLRGTNLPPSSPGETDIDGNPLMDTLSCDAGETTPCRNTLGKAYADLWFYSNPIFVETTR